ncbi:riboflavin synthase alpha chain [Candidatus Gastranaerophilus sp. (ex Termes propinquus)]|nr:riboflavin synthase alpha chain [Candidatus Gastranaerophilus sp. (ex Termes propinquus)]
MFTGLIEEVAKVADVKKSLQGARVCIEATFCSELKVGASIAVNGVCLTVVSCGSHAFEVEVMNETLHLTNISKAKNVNLERAMLATGRFDGHIVSGHIDGVAKFISAREDGFSRVLRFEYPTKQIILKGSICVNGVSLTISGLCENFFEVSIIPHTLKNTNLSALCTGDLVNIETDMIAKYVEKMYRGAQPLKSAIDENFLKEHGF